jgi:hypothetical protein
MRIDIHGMSAFGHGEAPRGANTIDGAWARRSLLVSTIALAMAMTAWLIRDMGPASHLEPELIRLLRAMVGIKGLIAIAATGLVLRRLGRPTRRGLATGYAGGLCVAAAALVWLWTLTNIPLGSLLFYSALFALVLVARADAALFLQERS